MTLPRLSFPAPAILACLAVAACAGDHEGQGRARGDRDDQPRARPSVFLSPAGQPFRAAAGQPYPTGVWFAQADANHDGRLTREEFRADFEAFFRILDANHDGVIDGYEISDYETKIAPEILADIERAAPQAQSSSANSGQGGGQGGGRRGGGGGGGGGGGRRGGGGQGGQNGGQGQGGSGPGGGGQGGGRLALQGAAAYSLLNVSEPVASADTDFNGKITLVEFLAAADRRFDLLDSMGLGYLTLAALPRTPQQIAMKGRKPKAE